MQRNTVIVLDKVRSLQQLHQLAQKDQRAILVSLTPRDDHQRLVARELTRQASSLEVVHGAKHLDRIAGDLRKPYAGLVASAADKIEVNGTRLRDAFKFENQISLWWLNEIFGRRSDLYPGFTRMCQLELIRTVIEERAAREVVLITEDPSLWQVVRDLCNRKELDFLARRPSPTKGWLRKTGMPRVIVSSLVWFARVAVQTALARFVCRAGPLPQHDSRPLCLFHTIYPSLWKGSQQRFDEKFDTVPHLLDQDDSYRAAYACTLSADGRHQHVTVRQFWRLCRRLKARQEKPDSLQMLLLDAYPRFRDVLAAAGQMRLILSYSRLERSLSYRSHWQLNGISFHPLLREELRTAMVRTPRYLLHALRVRRLVEELQPRCLVYYHFEFGLGRAIAFGSLTGSPETTLIGAQEGPIARLKLWSLNSDGELRFDEDRRTEFLSSPPVPDLALLEGTGALERLSEAGWPIDRLRVVGAPRISHIHELPRRQLGQARGDAPQTAQPIRVLIVLGGNDGDSILEACLPALDMGPRLHLTFKLHPRSGPSKGDVLRKIEDSRSGRPGQASFSVEDGDIYPLLTESDLVVATYSSVAMEAAALGYPLICLSLSDRITASPLIDVDAPQVRFAATSAELVSALESRLTIDADDPMPTAKLAEYFFHRLDGDSPRRWARAIQNQLDAEVSGRDQLI